MSVLLVLLFVLAVFGLLLFTVFDRGLVGSGTGLALAAVTTVFGIVHNLTLDLATWGSGQSAESAVPYPLIAWACLLVGIGADVAWRLRRRVQAKRAERFQSNPCSTA